MSDVRLDQLRVRIESTPKPYGSGETSRPTVLGLRPASVADLVAALLNEGGEIMEPFGLWWTSRLSRELAIANEPDDAEVFVLDVGKPGRYLVVPLEDE